MSAIAADIITAVSFNLPYSVTAFINPNLATRAFVLFTFMLTPPVSLLTLSSSTPPVARA
jgi:hypothetical protein